jgi:hypothetical protein
MYTTPSRSRCVYSYTSCNFLASIRLGIGICASTFRDSELFQSHGRVSIVFMKMKRGTVLFQGGMVVQERRGHACNRHTILFVPDRMIRFLDSQFQNRRWERVIIVCSSSWALRLHTRWAKSRQWRTCPMSSRFVSRYWVYASRSASDVRMYVKEHDFRCCSSWHIYIRNRSNARDLIGSQTYAKRLHGGVCDISDDSIVRVATVAPSYSVKEHQYVYTCSVPMFFVYRGGRSGWAGENIFTFTRDHAIYEAVKEGIELRRCQFFYSANSNRSEMLYARDFRPALAQTHTFRSKSTAIDAYTTFFKRM